MTTIVTTVQATTTVDTLVPEAAEGKVKFHTQRSNGTFRRVQFLAEGTKDREVAEWVAAQREEGVTMKAIAAEMHVSVPTVRRMLNALLLTQEIEEADQDEKADLVFGADYVEESAEAPAQS
jgi:DNA-binding NarL/FixJ family response regulator